MTSKELHSNSLTPIPLRLGTFEAHQLHGPLRPREVLENNGIWHELRDGGPLPHRRQRPPAADTHDAPAPQPCKVRLWERKSVFCHYINNSSLRSSLRSSQLQQHPVHHRPDENRRLPGARVEEYRSGDEGAPAEEGRQSSAVHVQDDG
jgi:hypothetical protein